MLGLVEGMLYAETAGIDVSKAIDLLGGGAAGSWSLANYGPRIAKVRHPLRLLHEPFNASSSPSHHTLTHFLQHCSLYSLTARTHTHTFSQHFSPALLLPFGWLCIRL